jgi:copper resistance protein B
LLRALPLLLVLLASPGATQRLAYENVLQAEHRVGPRLAYAPLTDEVSMPAPTPEAGEEGPVRAFYGDRLEWRPQRGGDAYNWDVSAEIGCARHGLWLATTGDGLFGDGLEYFEAQALYSRPVSESGLALQAGFRQDFVPRPRRAYAVLGIQGNVTDPLYVGGFGFLSNKGEFTARAFAYYDLALGDRLFLQPAVETEIAAADVPALGIGAGPVYAEAGLRLRYRFHDAFAPYVGVNWERLLGRTARMTRAEGDEVETTNIVLGLRSYF